MRCTLQVPGGCCEAHAVAQWREKQRRDTSVDCGPLCMEERAKIFKTEGEGSRAAERTQRVGVCEADSE